MLLGFMSVNVLKFILMLQEFCLVDYLVDFCLVLTADFEDESVYVNDARLKFCLCRLSHIVAQLADAIVLADELTVTADVAVLLAGLQFLVKEKHVTVIVNCLSFQFQLCPVVLMGVES